MLEHEEQVALHKSESQRPIDPCIPQNTLGHDDFHRLEVRRSKYEGDNVENLETSLIHRRIQYT